MAVLQKSPCNEANEEKEFYYYALGATLVDEGLSDQSVEEFFSDEGAPIQRKDLYPSKWKSAFYDPFRKRL